MTVALDGVEVPFTEKGSLEAKQNRLPALVLLGLRWF